MIQILYFLFSVVADQGLAKSRSRREKKDKGGRFAALEKLKKAKQSGEKHKYDVSRGNFTKTDDVKFTAEINCLEAV